MKILILGATGATGREVLRLTLDAGHEATAYVRSPDKLEKAPGLTMVKGAVTDTDALATALTGHDAIVSALGRLPGRKDASLQEDATAAVVQAATTTGVTRIVWLSGLGVGDSIASFSLSGRLLVRTALRGVFADKARAEAILRSSALDWTLAYPVGLSNAPGTEHYAAATLDQLGTVSGTTRIARADVARFLFDAATTGTYSRQIAALLPAA